MGVTWHTDRNENIEITYNHPGSGEQMRRAFQEESLPIKAFMKAMLAAHWMCPIWPKVTTEPNSVLVNVKKTS